MQSFYDSLSLDGIAHCSRYKLSRVDIWLPPLAINFPTPLVKLFVSRPSFTRNPSRTGGYRFEILTVSDREFSRIDICFPALTIHILTLCTKPSSPGPHPRATSMEQTDTGWACLLLRHVSCPALSFALPPSQFTLYPFAKNPRFSALPRAEFLYNSATLVGLASCSEV